MKDTSSTSLPNKRCPCCGTRLVFFNDTESWKKADVFLAEHDISYDAIIKCRKCKKAIGIQIKKAVA